MRHPYLIRLDEPEDWLDVHEDRDPRTGELVEEQHDILWPEGSDQLYEFNDSYFYTSTTYHEHSTGWETFFIHSGSMDLYARGKVATADAGDILFIPPYTAHKMTMLTKPVVWNGLFHGVGLLRTINDWALILKSNPQMLDDPEVKANYLGNKTNILRENPPYAKRVSKDDMHEIRPYDKPFEVCDFPGVSMRQYTGRWENNGKTELWLAELQKGFKVRYVNTNPNVDLFYILSGEVKFDIAGEKFVAGPRCLVKAPSFAPRSFETLSEVKMYDAGGSTHWLDLFGDLSSLKTSSPELLSDSAYVKGIKKRHECCVESAVFEGRELFF